MDNNIQNGQTDEEEEWLSIGDAAKLLNVSRDTLRRWEKKGKIKVYRSPTNRRRYKKSEIEQSFSPENNSKIKSVRQVQTPSENVNQVSQAAAIPSGYTNRNQIPTTQPAVTPYRKPVRETQPQSTPQETVDQESTEGGISGQTEQVHAQVRQSPDVQANTPPTVASKAANSYANSLKPPEKDNRQIPVRVEAESQLNDNINAKTKAKKNGKEEEILEIRPQVAANASYANVQAQKYEEKKDETGEKSGSYLKVAILIVSIFLIIAGLVIVGLVFLYPSQATPMLSPV